MRVLPSVFLVLLATLLAGCSSFRVPFYEEPAKPRPVPPASSAAEVSEDGKTIWIKDGGESDTQRQVDISNCYASARAQTARDAQIQVDRADSRRSSALGGEEVSFMNRMDEYQLDRQRDALFSRCMRAKGYSEG